MTDPETTSQVHLLTLIRDLHSWMRRLMQEGNASGLLECGAELKWLSSRAGLKA
jgi:hypothetical protein